MADVDWREVHANDFAVPVEAELAELTTELTHMLGDPDPVMRDQLAYPVLATWIERGVYDDLLPGLGDGLTAGLKNGLGERDTDSVFRRSFSALVVAECIARDSAASLVPAGKILDWGDRVATWLLQEQDLRGYVADRGWAHAIAHGADALGVLAQSPHVQRPELDALLGIIADRVVAPVDTVLTFQEPDRLAAATMQILYREVHAADDLVDWLSAITHTAGMHDAPKSPNAEAYLRALYLQLALGARQPSMRADLTLMLVESLRSSNPHFYTG